MKRYIYLISPQTINGAKFYNKLHQVLKTNKVRYFQLRLKKTSTSDLLKISKKIKKIARKNNVKFLINDKPLIAKMVGADGCHIGQKDMNFISSRKILGKKKIIGMTCHNSKKLALTIFAMEGLSLIKNLTLFFLVILSIFLDIFIKFKVDIFFNLNWKYSTLLVFST